MIKLAFIGPQRKVIKFEIEGKVVKYFDDIWEEGIQIIPKDNNLIRKLIRARKPNLRVMAALIMDSNKGKDLEEYNSCNTDEDVAEFIRKDCKSKGLLEVKFG